MCSQLYHMYGLARTYYKNVNEKKYFFFFFSVIKARIKACRLFQIFTKIWNLTFDNLDFYSKDFVSLYRHLFIISIEILKY